MRNAAFACVLFPGLVKNVQFFRGLRLTSGVLSSGRETLDAHGTLLVTNVLLTPGHKKFPLESIFVHWIRTQRADVQSQLYTIVLKLFSVSLSRILFFSSQACSLFSKHASAARSSSCSKKIVLAYLMECYWADSPKNRLQIWFSVSTQTSPVHRPMKQKQPVKYVGELLKKLFQPHQT